MKQALILCAGQASRLRPYSYSLSKAQLNFLNLPLLSYPWMIAEELKASRFLLSSHLFPCELKKTVSFLSHKDQETEVFFEKEPLGSVGTLRSLKKQLQRSPYFIYINGDALLFPSVKDKISEFETEFLSSDLSALFFAAPFKQELLKKRALYCDSKNNLKRIAFPEKLSQDSKNKDETACSLALSSVNKAPALKNKDETAYSFTGLALFKSSLLNCIKSEDQDLFQDFITPLFGRERIKVFIDEGAFLLEAGDKKSYLESTELCLKNLFPSQDSFKGKRAFIKERLEKCFSRFDPQDDKVGLKRSQLEASKRKAFLLAPSSVKGLPFLKLKGFSVLGSQVSFFGDTLLENSVLGSDTAVKGAIKDELIISSYKNFV